MQIRGCVRRSSNVSVRSNQVRPALNRAPSAQTILLVDGSTSSLRKSAQFDNNVSELACANKNRKHFYFRSLPSHDATHISVFADHRTMIISNGRQAQKKVIAKHSQRLPRRKVKDDAPKNYAQPAKSQARAWSIFSWSLLGISMPNPTIRVSHNNSKRYTHPNWPNLSAGLRNQRPDHITLSIVLKYWSIQPVQKAFSTKTTNAFSNAPWNRHLMCP